MPQKQAKRFRAAAKALVERLDPDIFAVGVFVDAPLELIERLAKEGSIDAAQLHGNESEAYLDALRSRCDLPLIKSLSTQDKHQHRRRRKRL